MLTADFNYHQNKYRFDCLPQFVSIRMNRAIIGPTTPHAHFEKEIVTYEIACSLQCLTIPNDLFKFDPKMNSKFRTSPRDYQLENILPIVGSSGSSNLNWRAPCLRLRKHAHAPRKHGTHPDWSIQFGQTTSCLKQTHLAMSLRLGYVSLVLCLIFGGATWKADRSFGQEVATANRTPSAKPNDIDFSRDIRPILSDTCFKCHGPDDTTREADLRLDTEEGVFDEGEVVYSGDLENSELYQRLITNDHDQLMPPPESGRKLTPEQIELIKKWIEQGAKWSGHWSLEPIKSPQVPKVKIRDWAKNDIDAFILKRLERDKLKPSPQADRITLCRRVYFDLTGLPPTPSQVDEFINDSSDNALEKLVDRLLESPHYGEHMARFWLDAARYGDTHGLHLDNYREMWPYRDWVIQSFNNNQSFREFTIEQLAGDLLPDPTDDQLIASGFNRAHVTTNEGGSIEEEVYVRNVIDRVATTGIVFMGLTTECASCHDHKFDPISQKEFYQLFAFFNNLDDKPMDGNVKDYAPVLRIKSDEEKQKLEGFEKRIADAKNVFDKALASFEYTEPKEVSVSVDLAEPTEFVWIEDSVPDGARAQGRWNFARKNSNAKPPVFSGNNSSFEKASGFTQHFFTDAPAPLNVDSEDTLFAHVYLDPKNPPRQIMLQFNDGSWEHRAYWGKNEINFGTDGTPGRLHKGDLPEAGKWVRLEVKASEVGFTKVSKINGWAFSQVGGKVYWDKSGVVSKQKQRMEYNSFNNWKSVYRKQQGNGLPGNIAGLFKKEAEKLTDSENKRLFNYFLTKVYGPGRDKLGKLEVKMQDLQKQLTDFRNSLPTSMISQERAEPRPAYILKRGEYEAKGDEVQRIVPAALPEFSEDLPRNRLGFAKWLVAEDHPLTSRVTVNRFWQQLFGTGLVKTSEDFGSQGEWPSHPELLDYLARDFMENDWDVKRLMKKIIMSATYQQSTKASPELLAIDPENRLLARGPRFRLDAETLRDSAFAAGNLLNYKMFGPGVKPPQPDGLWFAVGYSGSNTVRFKKDSGDAKVHRRSIYTFWKRTSPPPQMSIADAPSRESCSVRRERTNTPLLALMLMNDPQYVEAARYLAQLTLDQKPQDVQTAMQFMFRTTLSREPSPQELEILKSAFEEYLTEFKANVDKAKKLIAIGEKPAPDTYDASKLAAWTMIANTLMNMDEFITKN